MKPYLLFIASLITVNIGAVMFRHSTSLAQTWLSGGVIALGVVAARVSGYLQANPSGKAGGFRPGKPL